MLHWLTERLKAPSQADETPLMSTVAQHLQGADDIQISIVASIAGLLASIAYADRKYTQDEERRVRTELARVQGLSDAGLDAVCAILREHISTISAVESPVCARKLLELADRDLRLTVLDALIDVAAADGAIEVSETNLLRLTATALGLTQTDYNDSQARHREKLAVLRAPESTS